MSLFTSLYPEDQENPKWVQSFHGKAFNLNKENVEKDNKQIVHTNQVNKAFNLFRLVLSIFGRWPFKLKIKFASKSKTDVWISNNSFKTERSNLDNIEIRSNEVKEETIQWTYQVYSSSLRDSPLMWIYFLTTTSFLSVVLIFSVLGFCDFFLDWKLFSKSLWDEESRQFEGNLVPFVLVWSCLMHSSLSSISILLNRKKVVKLLNQWNVAVDSMNIKVPKSIKNYVFINHLIFLGFLIVVYIAYKIMYLNLIRGGATLLGILTFRPFLYGLNIDKDLGSLRIFGVVTIIYATYASRMFLLLFSFHSKLLRHGFKIWNERFKKLLKSSQIYEKMKCEKTFEDYKILLKLVRMTDEVFGVVLQSYYGSQLLNMCFELYYLARSGSHENEKTIDIIGALVVLCQNIYIFFAVSLDAAFVNEEATKGFEILRSIGVNPDDNIYRKYLITNMQIVFSQRIVLTGGKFFAVDRPFIVTVLGAVFTYFIIVLQIGPAIHHRFEET